MDAAALKAPSLDVHSFGLENAAKAPSLGMQPFGLDMFSAISALVAALFAALIALIGTIGDTAIFNCRLGGHVLLNSVLQLFGGSRARLSDTAIFNCRNNTTINFLDGTDAPVAIGACDRCGQLAHGMAASSDPCVSAQILALDSDARISKS